MPKKILNKEKWIPADKLNLPVYIRDKDGHREKILGTLVVRNKQFLVTERRYTRVHRKKTMICTEMHEIYVLNDVFPNNSRVCALQREQHEMRRRSEEIRDELCEEQDKLIDKLRKERIRIAGAYRFPYEKEEY